MRPSTDQSAMRRVTVPEAAQILGVTPDAVRSRLRRGTLQRDEAADGTVLVVLTVGDRPDGHAEENDGQTDDQPTVAYINELKSRVELLERELEAWKTEAQDWKEAARRNDHLLARALEHLPTLEAPQEPRESPETVTEPVANGEEGPSEEEQHKSWWRRIFGI